MTPGASVPLKLKDGRVLSSRVVYFKARRRTRPTATMCMRNSRSHAALRQRKNGRDFRPAAKHREEF